jgi:hypothetical protein
MSCIPRFALITITSYFVHTGFLLKITPVISPLVEIWSTHKGTKVLHISPHPPWHLTDPPRTDPAVVGGLGQVCGSPACCERVEPGQSALVFHGYGLSYCGIDAARSRFICSSSAWALSRNKSSLSHAVQVIFP